MKRTAMVAFAAALSPLGFAGAAHAHAHHHEPHSVLIIQQQVPATVVRVRRPDPMGNPAVFSRHVEQRLEGLTAEMAREKSQGYADAQAINRFNARKENVRLLVSQAGASGWVSPEERRRVERQIEELQASVDDARVNNRAVGGGPR